MKRILLFSCLFYLVGISVAQQQVEYPVSLDHSNAILAPMNVPGNGTAPLAKTTNGGTLMTDSSTMKTCYEIHWASTDVTTFGGGLLSIGGRAGYFPGTGGVVGTTGLKIGSIYISQEIATSYNTIQTGQPVYLTEVILPSSGGIDFFQAKQGGSSWDTYSLKIYGIAPVGTSGAFPASSTGAPTTDGIDESKLYASTTYTLEGVQLAKNIVLDQPIPLPNFNGANNKYWIKFLIDTVGVDDSLAFGVIDAGYAQTFNNNEYKDCGSDGGTVFSWAHPTTKVAATVQRLFTIGNGSASNCPQPNTDWPRCYINTNAAIFPVYTVYGTGRNEGTALANSSVKMYGLYPNPATTKVKVNYDLTTNTSVRLIVLDNQQRVVRDFSMGAQPAGSYAHEINVSDLASGSYYVQLLSNGQALTQKLQVVR